MEFSDWVIIALVFVVARNIYFTTTRIRVFGEIIAENVENGKLTVSDKTMNKV